MSRSSSPPTSPVLSTSLDALHQLAASASEVHAATQRAKPNTKLRVELKSEEDRTRKRQLRLLKNRQSAALSRQRKKEYISDLESKAGVLGLDKSDLEFKVSKLASINLEYKLHIEKLEKQLLDTMQENTDLKFKLAQISGLEKLAHFSGLDNNTRVKFSSAGAAGAGAVATPPIPTTQTTTTTTTPTTTTTTTTTTLLPPPISTSPAVSTTTIITSATPPYTPNQ